MKIFSYLYSHFILTTPGRQRQGKSPSCLQKQESPRLVSPHQGIQKLSRAQTQPSVFTLQVFPVLHAISGQGNRVPSLHSSSWLCDAQALGPRPVPTRTPGTSSSTLRSGACYYTPRRHRHFQQITPKHRSSTTYSTALCVCRHQQFKTPERAIPLTDAGARLERRSLQDKNLKTEK